MCSKSAELQSQPFPFPLLHQMFGVYILIPREQSAVLEFLSVQHYRVHLTTSCSAFILLQPCPPFFKFTIIFPLVFVSKSEKTHPSQPKGTHLSAPGVWGLLLWNKSMRGKANCKTSSCGLDWFWLHWWKSSKTLLTYNLIRICQMRTKYCTESCTEFFYIENFTYLYHIHFVHLKKISTSIVIQNAWQSRLLTIRAQFTVWIHFQ